LGTGTRVAAEALEAIIADLVTSDQTGTTAEKVAEALKPKYGRTAVYAVLGSLVDHGVLSRSGKGTKGDPFRYVRAEAHSSVQNCD
jgi:predicted transcriptional regulator